MLPEYFAYLTIVIGLLAMYTYIKSMLQGKARPNRVSWILWGVVPMIATYIGYKSGISLPILAATFMAGFISVSVVIVSFFTEGAYWKTEKSDIWCAILSAIAIVVWVATKNGVVSLIFAILADLFAGIPTMIKAWKYSDTENATSFGYGVLNQFVTFLIIKDFTFLNFAFPLYVIIANMIIIIGIKRKYLSMLLKIGTER